MPDDRARGLLPLLCLAAVVVLVSVGAAQGIWLPNLHNGLLAVACTAVGAYVLHQRAGHAVGGLLLAAGLVEGVLFAGRQAGRTADGATAAWSTWVGVWPVPLALGLVTATVLVFPDGRLPSPRWRPLVPALVAVTTLSCLLSALWPVAYDVSQVEAAHPVGDTAPRVAEVLWRAVSLPSFVVLQLLWPAALLARVRRPGSARALLWLLGAAAITAAALLLGLALAGSPRAGLLTVALVPVAAGLAVVHAQQASAHTALTWLSRSTRATADLPADLARTTAEALAATGAEVWMGSDESLHAVGLWPDADATPDPTTLGDLVASGDAVRPVLRDGEVAGALRVVGAAEPSRAQQRLLDDLAGQAGLVLEHLALTRVLGEERRSGHLDALTPREREVLELIADGLSNAAICERLHLSVKTVEPVVSSVFAKLDLHADSARNRRVLAALAYERAISEGVAGPPATR